MTHRFDANFVAPFCLLAAGCGARVSVYRRATDDISARRKASHVLASQVRRLVCVRVMRATCATCRRGCARRRRPRAFTTFFHWDIGTLGRIGGKQ